MTDQTEIDEVTLYRTRGQRAFGWFMVFLYSVMALGFPVIAIVLLGNGEGGPAVVLLGVDLVMIVVARQAIPVAHRLATSAPGVVQLTEDGIVIIDESVFEAPLRVSRAEIASISDAPTGPLVYRRGGEAFKEGATLVSLLPVRPNLLIQFCQPRVLEMSRRNDGLFSAYPLRPPNSTRSAKGLWLRTSDINGEIRLVRWSRPVR